MVIIAIIVGCLAIGVGIVTYRIRSNASLAGQGAAAPATQSPANVITQEALDLPVGPPLPAAQLIAPRYDKAGAPAQLWLVDSIDPSASTTLGAAQDGSARAVAMSTDRRTITYLDTGANVLRTMPSAGGSGRRLFASPDGCGTILHASWSPTDLTVLILECKLATGPARFVVVDNTGRITKELDTGPLHPSDPTISPDGETIAFSATGPDATDKSSSIFVMPIDGSAPPTQVTDGAVDTDPSWSPDGVLAFGRQVGDPKAEDSDILTVSPAGGTPSKVTSGPAADGRATWSPDGQTIAFVSDRDQDGSKSDKRDLWLVAAKGGEPRPLGLEAYSYATPTWWHR